MAILPYNLSPVTNSPVIWAEKANLEFFCAGVQAVTGTGGTSKEVTFGAASVSRYPGDKTPFTRKGGSRRIYLDTPKSSVGTPGSPFWLEWINPDDESMNEIRQFTCVGSMGLLRQQVKFAAKLDLTFRMSSGLGFEILTSTAPLQV